MGLEKIFGKSGIMKLKTHLVKMVLSSSKDEFDITLNAAQELLQYQNVRDGHLESNLALFADRRGTFASYCLADIPGNRGLHGNACSEQNHSSVLCYLNVILKIRPKLYFHEGHHLSIQRNSDTPPKKLGYF